MPFKAQNIRFLLRSMGNGEWQPDGAVNQEGKIWGTYLHGLFESGSFLQAWLSQVGAEQGIGVQVAWQQWQEERDSQLDRLADALEGPLNMDTIRALAGVVGK